MNVKKLFLVPVVSITFSLSCCGGGFPVERKLEFNASDLNEINVTYFSKKDNAWDSSISVNKERDVEFVYEQFFYLRTKKEIRTKYKTSEEDCAFIYVANFSFDNETITPYKMTYYVYSHTDGTVVYPNGDAYAFYGNARYGTYDRIKKHLNGEDREYYLTTIGPSDPSICPDLPRSKEYEVGQMLRFRVQIVTDVTFYPLLNDKRLEFYKDDGVVGGYTYYEFAMPNKDSTLLITSE